MRRAVLGMLIIGLLGALLALPAAGQQSWAVCVPSPTMPSVSTGETSYENGMASVTLKGRWRTTSGSNITVRVRVTFDGHTSSDQTVTIARNGRTGTAQLGVPAAGRQVVGFKILDDSSYTWCKRTAGVTVPRQTPIYIPPQPTPPPTPDPTPPDYLAEIIADAPPRPTPNPDATEAETRHAWICWATFGNPVALAALGVTESC